ncbi:MAG: membrane protein insertion efficiency factor YidD [Candidatus Marinimicrobia bacterium]|jgi:hypothetical protein|nr:membrane protein insertion efficiency factor YidD [Candidatus Neomarinimicrobiota bacterium]|tara:strand:+ start:5257 stop:5961 length:705 start_codon:yes stop_codon:yes gene_type:complete
MSEKRLQFKGNLTSPQIGTGAIILLLIAGSIKPVSGQTRYPADSILTAQKTSIVKKTVLVPVSLWQRLSYKTSLLNCQFHPSCSNYAALSISHHGVLVGSVLTADRIIRCNPAALHYQVQQLSLSNPSSVGFHNDGRLENPVPDRIFETSAAYGKSPLLAAGISAMIPGAGRIYTGRAWDGLFGFITVGMLTTATYTNVSTGNGWGTALSAAAALIFYCGEIIGAYRAAAETAS